ncbi:MAG: TetR/AcrR family transcriptional regulator [Pseudomonadota bacterium]
METRRADATREKIIKAARTLFVKNGFAGTSMGKIASTANVPHSLVFHHFKNKQNLWMEVKMSIVRIFKQGQESSSILPTYNQSLTNFLQQLISRSIDFYQNNPDIVRMINWQRLEHEQEQGIGIKISQESEAWIVAFKRYQDKGEIKSELKPEFIMTLILSIVSSAAMDSNVFIKKEEDNKAYINFCVQSLLKALCP